MKNVNIRYCGSDSNRFHILQRGTGDIWTGDGWSRIMDCAKIFREYRDAQMECAALQRQQYGGMPLRTFKLEMVVSLVADDVGDISPDQLAEFISQAARIQMESSQFGDGPVEGSFVQLQMKLATLEETTSARKRF